jgi:hypothetical protein
VQGENMHCVHLVSRPDPAGFDVTLHVALLWLVFSTWKYAPVEVRASVARRRSAIDYWVSERDCRRTE